MNALTCPANVDARAAASDVVTASRIARIEVFDNLQIAEPIWRALEADGALATPYQRYDWILSWQIHIGKRNGVTPFLIVGREPDGTPVFLWPLGTRRVGPTQFDLGVGEARFKRLFCTEIEPLFDTFRPLTTRGSIAALGYHLRYRLKGKIKRSPTIWDALTTLRRRSNSLRRSARRRRPQRPQAAATRAPE